MFGFDVRDKGKGELETWKRWMAREARTGRENWRAGDGGAADGAENRERGKDGARDGAEANQGGWRGPVTVPGR